MPCTHAHSSKPVSCQLGSVKANGRKAKSCLCRVFNFKLGYFVMPALARHIQACPSQELKTRPRFCLVSLSLSMYQPNMQHHLLLPKSSIGQFVEQMVKLSRSFRCDRIDNSHCYDYSHTLMRGLSPTEVVQQSVTKIILVC